MAKAKRAEALGYDILLMPDHLTDQFAIGPALALVAEATTTLRIGTFVLQNDLRHPALVAKEAATLDVLSDGRFELGLGAGGSLLADYERTGIPFDPPGTRVGRLEESLRIIKGLAAEEPLTFTGRYYTIAEHRRISQADPTSASANPRSGRRAARAFPGGTGGTTSSASWSRCCQVAASSRWRRAERRPSPSRSH